MSQESRGERSNAADIRKMLAASGYSDKAIRCFIEKPWMGETPDADQVSEMRGTCGDTMSICLKVESGVIRDLKYQVLGCPGAISSAMATVDQIKGKTIEDGRTLNDGEVFRLLENIPAKKHHCIQLTVKTLHKALDEYIQRFRYCISCFFCPKPLVCSERCP